MTLSEERLGVIAYKSLIYLLKMRGFTLSMNIRREIQNVARAINVSPEEAAEFAEKIVREVVDEVFPPK